MTLTKKHKLYLALLALAIVGFMVDRLFLSEGVASPKQAKAAPAAPATVAPAVTTVQALVASTPAAGKSEASGDSAIVAERLKALAKTLNLDPAEIRDAFKPAEDWTMSAPPPEPAAAPQPKARPDFARNHKLTAVLLSKGGGSAVVNGKVVEVGQELDWYKLVGLEANSATFQSADDRVELGLYTAEKGRE